VATRGQVTTESQFLVLTEPRRPGGHERTCFSTKITLSSLRESAIHRIARPALHDLAVSELASQGHPRRTVFSETIGCRKANGPS